MNYFEVITHSAGGFEIRATRDVPDPTDGQTLYQKGEIVPQTQTLSRAEADAWCGNLNFTYRKALAV